MKKSIGLILAILIVSLALVGCEDLPENQKPAATKPGTSNAGSTAYPVAAYPVGDNQSAYPGGNINLLKIIKADNTSVDLTLSELSSITKVKITADGKAQEGYKLLDILSRVKVSSLNKVTLTNGKNSVTLNKAEVDDQVILSLAEGVTLISPKLNPDQWLKYVIQIKVE